MQHVRVPGMLHGRVVRPRGQRTYGAGAKIVSVEEASIRAIPGARVLRKGDFLGVVAENEWDAIRAAQQLKVVWETPPALPGNAGLHEHMRAAKTEENIVLERGNVATGLTGAAHRFSQTCLGPYQAHVPFGPNCAVADVRADSALVMCSTQDVYGTRNTCRACWACRRKDSRAVLRRIGHLRPQLLRRRRASGCPAIAARRKAGALAVHALG